VLDLLEEHASEVFSFLRLLHVVCGRYRCRAGIAAGRFGTAKTSIAQGFSIFSVTICGARKHSRTRAMRPSTLPRIGSPSLGHQLIIATAMIAPNLGDERCKVDSFSRGRADAAVLMDGSRVGQEDLASVISTPRLDDYTVANSGAMSS